MYVPDARELVLALHGDDLLQGRVLDVSDSGARQDAYVVVKVDGIEEPLIVPSKWIRGVL